MFLFLALVTLAPGADRSPEPIQLVATFETEGRCAGPWPYLSITPDGKQVVAAVSFDRVCKTVVGDLTTGKWTTRELGVVPVCLLGGGKVLAAVYDKADGRGGTETGTALLSFPELKPLSRYPNRWIKLPNPSGTAAVCRVAKVGAKGQSYDLWDWKADKVLCVLDTSENTQLVGASFRADGKQVAVQVKSIGPAALPAGAKPEPAHTLLFDAGTGKRLARFDRYGCCAAISPDGKRVVLAGDGPAGRPERDAAPSTAFAFWDAASGKTWLPVKRPHLFPAPQRFLVAHYLPDGRHLAVVNLHGVCLWDLETELLVDPSDPEQKPKRPRGGYHDDTQVAFRPTADGLLVATLTPMGAIHVWKVTAPKPKQP